MRVLFLLSCLEPAGSETYCVSLAKAWGSAHEVFWISDRLHFGQTYQSMPISKRAVPWGLLNTARVIAFIKQHRIDIVHSHSRRAHWVAAQAALMTRARHVSTIHQPPPVHLFSKCFPCFGRSVIAIDEAVADHLEQRFHVDRSRIALIRNGISLDDHASTLRDTPGTPKILMIGRLTGGRWKTLQFFLKTLEDTAGQLPPALYQVVGRVPEDKRYALTRQLSVLNSRLAPSRVDLAGFIQDLGVAIRNADGVIAAGRSAMETLANARPLLMLGEGGVLGLCQPSTWCQAQRSNFGDHLDAARFDSQALAQALRELLTRKSDLAERLRWGRSMIEQHYNAGKTAAQIHTLYQRLL